MNARTALAPLFTVAALAVASSSVFAAPTTQGLAREAAPIGQRDAVSANTGGAPLSRADVRQQTLAARADGSLYAVGEADEPVSPRQVAATTLTRREVRAETLAAARAGELPLPGEGEFSVATRAPISTSAHATAHTGAFSRLFAKLHGNGAASTSSGS